MREVLMVLFHLVGVASGFALVGICLIYLLVPPRVVTTYITYERISYPEQEGAARTKEGA